LVLSLGRDATVGFALIIYSLNYAVDLASLLG
jgi:hypothetical protein